MEPSTRVKSQSAGKVSGCENWVVISTAQNPRLHWRESHTLTNIATISTICQPFALSWTVLDVCLAILTLASGVKVLQLCIPHQPKHASGVSQGMSIYHEKRSSYPWKETSSRRGTQDFFHKNLHHITHKHLRAPFWERQEKKCFPEQVGTWSLGGPISKLKTDRSSLLHFFSCIWFPLFRPISRVPSVDYGGDTWSKKASPNRSLPLFMFDR